MNVVQDFGGLRTDGELLNPAPSVPRRWKAFSFKIIYRGAVLSVRVDRRKAIFKVVSGKATQLKIFGKKYKVGPQSVVVELPARASVK